MTGKYIIRSIALIIIFCLSLPAFAGIGVVPAVITLGQDQRSQDFRVKNRDPNKPAYVKIEIRQLDTSVTPNKLVNVVDPKKIGFLVSPTKFIVPPSASRTIRLALFQTNIEKEQVYMLRVVPQEGDLIMLDAGPGKSDIQAGLHIIIAYGVKVTLRPNNPKTHFSLIRHGQDVVASNQGNTVIVLSDGKQCASSDKCDKVDGRYEITPGSQTKFTVPKAMPVIFSQSVLGETTSVQSN